MKRTTIWLPEEQLEGLEREAVKKHVSPSAVIRWAIDEYLEAHPPSVPKKVGNKK